MKNYNKKATKAEVCRLAMNWYQATGHKLPKVGKKSPYSDTKDPYVLMAYQLGIVKKTSDKKFHPDEKISRSDCNKILKILSASLMHLKEHTRVERYPGAARTEKCDHCILPGIQSK